MKTIPEKLCNKCKRMLAISSFYIRKSGIKAGKPRSHCKECEAKASRLHQTLAPEIYAQRARAYRIKYPERYKRTCRRTTWKKMGWNPDEVEAFVKIRNGTCEICGKQGDWRALAVDHCHKTNKLRGVLCSQCNVGLGSFRDRPDLLFKAADYLKRHAEVIFENTGLDYL